MPSKIMICVALAAFAALPLRAAPEPVAWWDMESISAEGVVYDKTGNGRDAQAHGLDGKLPTVEPGIAGQALRFSAEHEQYLEVGAWQDLAAPQAFTVMAWILPRERGKTYEIIGNKGDRSGEGPWPGWRLRYFWTRAMFQIGTSDAEEPSVSSPEWSTVPGHWSHVAVTYDGTTLRLYVNCIPAGEQVLGKPVMPGTRAIVIGNYVGRKNAYAFDGLIDELKFFDAELTEAQIFTAATQGMAP